MTTAHGTTLVPTIGAATNDTRPGGIVEIDDRTGVFTSYFGPRPTTTGPAGPRMMLSEPSVRLEPGEH